ncbi:hypothetical protein GCM10023213_47830 [Prosthecobacter algae]|uniref:Uncharacterized protein n=1 Tax=Prosthecobacter algae TaxID=1144682 RepID=A0ABP9PRG8_9BACT
MSSDPLTDPALKARIDTPDFVEILSADSEGSFYADVTTYLDAWQGQIKSYQDAGLSRGEFDDLSRLSNSLQTTGRVLEFFVKLQKLQPEKAHEN